MSLDSNISKCKEFMSMSGLPIFDDIITDSKIHRYSITPDKPKDKDEWYVCHLYDNENIVVVFSSWNTSRAPAKPYKWTSYTDNKVPDNISLELNKRVQEHQEQRRQEKIKSMEGLQIALNSAKKTKEHPYLTLKGISGFEVLTIDGIETQSSIIVPIYDIELNLVGAQLIAPDGTKKNWPASSCAGGFLVIGDLENPTTPPFIAEGYATGISAHQASGRPVIVAFGCSNMVRVAEAIINTGQVKNIDLLQDNDKAGADVAEVWKAKGIGNVYVPPTLKEGNDWNDAAKEIGTQAVRNLFLSMDEGLWLKAPWQSFGFEDFRLLDIPPVDWCIENFMTSGSVNVIAGAGGVGKSMVSADMAIAAAMGKRIFWNWRTPRNGQRVLYVDGELPGPILKERWEAAVKRWEVSKIDKLTLMPVLMFEDGRDPNLYLPQHRIKLDSLIEDNDLIVLDNFNCLCRRLTGDGDTYQADENKWTELYLWMRRWCAKGKTFLFVMHLTKSGSLQGTSRILGDASTVLQLSKMRPELKKSPAHLAVIVEFLKGRSIPPHKQEPFGAELMEAEIKEEGGVLREFSAIDIVRGKDGLSQVDDTGPWLPKGKKELAQIIVDKNLAQKGVVNLGDLVTSDVILRVQAVPKTARRKDGSSVEDEIKEILNK